MSVKTLLASDCDWTDWKGLIYLFFIQILALQVLNRISWTSFAGKLALVVLFLHVELEHIT